MRIFYSKRAAILSPFFFVPALIFNFNSPSPGQGHWENQISGSTDTLLNVKAVNGNVVWASGSGGCVLRTVDGGAHWVKRNTPLRDFDNVCVEPMDSATAWVVSIDAASGTDFRIFKTLNGGLSWNQIFRTEHTFGDAVRFFDALHGIALGDPYPGDYFNLYITSDGGSSWRRVSRSNIPPADSVRGEFGVTACLSLYHDNAWFATASQSTDFHPRIFRSTDRGLTWTASLPVSGLNGIAVSIEFTDELHGVVVDNLGGRWASTVDGGKSWLVHEIGENLWLRDIKRVPGSSTLMIAGGSPDSGYVFSLVDTDTSWNEMALPVGTQRIRSLTFGSDSTGWAVGGKGEILMWTER